MAIRLLTTTAAGTKHFSCLSSDISTLATDVLPLSSALVTDSPGLIMVWDGDDWAQYPAVAGPAATVLARVATILSHDALAAQEAIGAAQEAIAAAMSGDMVLRVTPAAMGSSASDITAAIAGDGEKYTRDILVELVDSNGAVHTWSSSVFAVAGSEVTAGDGTAVTSAETVALDKGVGTCTLEYIGTWAAEDVATVTVTGGTVLGHTVSAATSVDTVVE